MPTSSAVGTESPNSTTLSPTAAANVTEAELPPTSPPSLRRKPQRPNKRGAGGASLSSDSDTDSSTKSSSGVSIADAANRPQGGSRPRTQRKYDSNGFRLRQQVVDSKQLRLSDVLGDTPTAFLDPSFKVISISDDIAQGAKYVLQGDGLRRVPPYYFTYMTYCKQRWRDRTIFDIFSNEFREREKEFYRNLINKGEVTINGKSVGIDTVVRNGDLITHRAHKHEPPVSAKPIEIVHQDADIIVIDKPAGIPVHPTGRYRYNTITEIMKYDMGMQVHPAHRLDRLTSGIMIFARTGKAANDFSGRLRNRTVYKEYVARVLGEFPEGEIICDMPVLTVDPRLGLNMVKAEGKPATTVFNRISYNGKTSVVRCKPLTGRTHQIRIHLQYLGHAIANDPIYANRRVFGIDLAKGGVKDESDVVAKLSLMGREEEARSAAYEEIQEQHNAAKGEKLTGELCEICTAPLFYDPRQSDLEIWLHAQKYWSTEDNWTYETKMPSWAAEDFEILN
ncbi:pseudouridine synthase [Limtongia smithiae]|uniref:pseudouridine synthase n=1 Tax=Limtongia smithiae TaxID=1125753 RepID=UPI0034CECBE9